MGRESLESLTLRRQPHLRRLPGREIHPRGRSKFGSRGEVNLDPDGAEPPLRRVLDGSDEGARLRVEGQDQASTAPYYVPGLACADVDA